MGKRRWKQKGAYEICKVSGGKEGVNPSWHAEKKRGFTFCFGGIGIEHLLLVFLERKKRGSRCRWGRE